VNRILFSPDSLVSINMNPFLLPAVAGLCTYVAVPAKLRSRLQVVARAIFALLATLVINWAILHIHFILTDPAAGPASLYSLTLEPILSGLISTAAGMVFTGGIPIIVVSLIAWAFAARLNLPTVVGDRIAR